MYVSIDLAERFTQLLNFLQNVAEDGYDVQAELMARPDAVAVATVHKMKGLEFPAVFVADVEAQRFPPAARGYSGWLPAECMAPVLARGAYGGTASRNGEARLFYTAMTRAERYLYISGAANLPGGKKARRVSPYAGQLQHAELRREAVDPGVPPLATPAIAEPCRRGDASVLPTTYSQIRYYLRCPHDYRLRTVYGFSPPIVEMFGYGQTVHAAVGKLHEQFPNHAPTKDEARRISDDVFHLKHVPPSREPETRPGAYENAKQAAANILASYACDYVDDFHHQRQVERPFEVPIKDAVISGTIDLLLRLDDNGHLVGAGVIDFKAMEGGPDATTRADLDWGICPCRSSSTPEEPPGPRGKRPNRRCSSAQGWPTRGGPRRRRRNHRCGRQRRMGRRPDHRRRLPHATLAEQVHRLRLQTDLPPTAPRIHQSGPPA